MGKKFSPTFVCRMCKETKPREEARLKNGVIKDTVCYPCRYVRYSKMWRKITARTEAEWAALKATTCSKCGFTGERCQFDLNHIDGDRYNNDITNLETLCANCHRLVTYQNKHFENRYDTQKKRSHKIIRSSMRT